MKQLSQFFEKRITGEKLLNIIRVLKEDPHYFPEYDQIGNKYLESFTAQLAKNFEMNRDRCVREVLTENISKDLTEIFGSAELLQLKGYNEDEAKKLQNAGCPGFAYVMPLRILKSYTLAVFSRNISDALKRIETEGFFESQTFKREYVDALAKCDTFLETIDEFEQELSSVSNVSMSAVHEYIEQYKRGEKVIVKLSQINELIENMAREIAEKGTTNYFLLANQLKEMLEDYRKFLPTLISNIKTINGDKNREFMKTVMSGYNSIVKLVRVLKNFTIIRA